MRPTATIIGTPTSMDPDAKTSSVVLHFGTWVVRVSHVASGFLRQPLRVEAEQTDSGRWNAIRVTAASKVDQVVAASRHAPPAPKSAPAARSPVSPTAGPSTPKSPFLGRDTRPALSVVKATTGAPAPRSALTPARPRPAALVPAAPVEKAAFRMPTVTEDPHDPLNDVPY